MSSLPQYLYQIERKQKKKKNVRNDLYLMWGQVIHESASNWYGFYDCRVIGNPIKYLFGCKFSQTNKRCHRNLESRSCNSINLVLIICWNIALMAPFCFNQVGLCNVQKLQVEKSKYWLLTKWKLQSKYFVWINELGAYSLFNILWHQAQFSTLCSQQLYFSTQRYNCIKHHFHALRKRFNATNIPSEKKKKKKR